MAGCPPSPSGALPHSPPMEMQAPTWLPDVALLTGVQAVPLPHWLLVSHAAAQVEPPGSVTQMPPLQSLSVVQAEHETDEASVPPSSPELSPAVAPPHAKPTIPAPPRHSAAQGHEALFILRTAVPERELRGHHVHEYPSRPKRSGSQVAAPLFPRAPGRRDVQGAAYLPSARPRYIPRLAGLSAAARASSMRTSPACTRSARHRSSEMHPLAPSRLHGRRELRRPALAHEGRHGVRHAQHLEGRDATGSPGARQQALHDDRAERVRELDADLRLTLWRIRVDDALDGRGGRAAVQRREHQVSGLGSRERQADGLRIAHLPEQEHVWILAEARREGRSRSPRRRARSGGGARATPRRRPAAYSMGSSSVVRMIDWRRSASWPSAASVVDLPEPVAPHTRPGRAGNPPGRREVTGRCSAESAGALAGSRRSDAARPFGRAEHVRRDPAHARHVDPEVARRRAHHARRQDGRQIRAVPRSMRRSAPSTRHQRGLTVRQVQIARTQRERRRQQALEHRRWSAVAGGIGRGAARTGRPAGRRHRAGRGRRRRSPGGGPWTRRRRSRRKTTSKPPGRAVELHQERPDPRGVVRRSTRPLARICFSRSDVRSRPSARAGCSRASPGCSGAWACRTPASWAPGRSRGAARWRPAGRGSTGGCRCGPCRHSVSRAEEIPKASRVRGLRPRGRDCEAGPRATMDARGDASGSARCGYPASARRSEERLVLDATAVRVHGGVGLVARLEARSVHDDEDLALGQMLREPLQRPVR